jgi:hypothetical protein
MVSIYPRRMMPALLGALAGVLAAAIPTKLPAQALDDPTPRATEVEDAFEDFIRRFQKNYTASEREVRFAAFKENYAFIKEHNKGNHTSEMGITIFADLTRDEFRRSYLASNNTFLTQKFYQGLGFLGAHFPDGNLTDLPKSVDWRARGAVTDVKNQGTCGGCWAFATTGALEGAWKIATGNLVSLSEQQLVDCTYNRAPYRMQGCGGGNPILAYDWLTTHALCNEASYQYADAAVPQNFNGPYSCSHSCRVTIARGGVAGYRQVPPHQEQALMDALANHGPVSVAIEANAQSFQLHHRGVYADPRCFMEGRVDHAVLAVGYGTDPHGGDYWLVKNSWGPHWGENGYIRIARDGGRTGVCGILTEPAYPEVDGSKAVPPDAFWSLVLGAALVVCCCCGICYFGLKSSSCFRRRPVQRAPLLAGPTSGGARVVAVPQPPWARAAVVAPQATATALASGTQAPQGRSGNSAGSRLVQQQNTTARPAGTRPAGSTRQGVQPQTNQALRGS